MSFDIETVNKNREKILEKVVDAFSKELLLTPVVGVELEFYLLDEYSKPISEENKFLPILHEVRNSCFKRNIEIASIDRERGAGQFELRTKPCKDILTLSENLERVRQAVKDAAKTHGATALFESMPFADDCGSSLQVNVSLLKRDNNQNIFSRIQDKNSRDLQENPNILFAIGGLCDLMHESMAFFLPSDVDYLRCSREKNLQLYERGHCPAPINVSWGGNNRTTAIRIPSTFVVSSNVGELVNQRVGVSNYPFEADRRIEHRVPSASADPYLAIANVLLGIHHGISNRITPPEKVHGNAFDTQYGLVGFAGNLEQARSDLENGRVVKGYLGYNS